MPCNKIAHILMVALLGLGLGACATAAQREAQTIRSTNVAMAAQFKACVQAIYSSPEVDPIRAHIPLDIRDATLEQMTDTDFATDVEIQALLDAHPKYQACRKAALDQIAVVTPTIVPMFTKRYTEEDDKLIDLVQKKITWGDFIRGVKDSLPEFQARLMAEYQRIGTMLNQENQAELQQRQAAANAMMQYYQTQQMINEINRTVITNCNQIGTMTNCITH